MPRMDPSAARRSRMTELDYLEGEAAVAKDNMQESCRRIGRSIQSTAGHVWEKHPVLVTAAAAGLGLLGAAWIGRSRRRQTTRTVITESESPRERSLISRAGTLIGKTLFSLMLAKLTAPPMDEFSPGTGEMPESGATS